MLTEKILAIYNNSLLPWLSDHGIKLLLIFIGAFLLYKFGGIFISNAVKKSIKGSRFRSKEAEEKRETTLIQIFNGTLKVLVLVVLVLVVLSEIGVDIGPLLAGAGVFGVALGFGAQYIIRDILSGVFILLENQYRVGDVIGVGNTYGVVEKITLRTTKMRDLDGAAHYIPNGEIKKASNLSKEFSGINLNVGVSYSSDIEKVIRVVNKVGKSLAKDPEWKNYVVEAPQFLRVDDFADSAIVIKILGKTKPLKQWDVTGELRKRLKVAFDKEGIEIPFPQMVVHKTKD